MSEPANHQESEEMATLILAERCRIRAERGTTRPADSDLFYLAADRLVEQANQLAELRELIEALGEPTPDGDRWYVLDSRDDRVYLTDAQAAAWEAK